MAIMIKHEVPVKAPAEVVWGVIADMPRYGEWNPFVVACESSLVVSAPIRMKVRVMPFMAQPQTETVLEHIAGESLSYGIAMPFGMLSSNRRHLVVPKEDGTSCYYSTFELNGWFSPVVKLFVGRQLQRGFSEMSAAIGRRALTLSTS
ncbi:polyketide cyclase/dehydrase/lipid transport protein [Sinobacterium caligoides]|uniref:Polyketide cyclase/dehydrase/lipid transport protein n=1 Tax=Sinobacterium caligoides TaxID=933926 RepID=A0A3N2DG29_9GAMM|nr:SRPBCC domain-containing protein [Sinobacterium caligoides]ROR98747.1 polyketide cyclase/dehydrase/lipid transport protein [Sinobacterium caligoides]